MSQPLNFPARIYQILENESPEIVQWNSNGLSFRLVNHIRFEAEIIPKYFRHRKLSSVQRQLNVYGFRSISRGEHKRSFYHPLFKRGNWEVVKQMQRYVPTKGGQNADCDATNNENAETNCDPTENCSDFNSAVAGLFGSQPLAVRPAVPSLPASAPSAAMRASVATARTPGVPTFTRSVSGGIKICTDDDVSDHHFANDFRPQSEVGHEQTAVHVQPVDYSIPLHFRTDNSASLPAYSNSAVRKNADSEQSARCDWAVNDDMLAWAGMLFEPEEENLDFLWAAASAPACAAAPEPLKSDPDDAPATGMPPPPSGVVRMQSGGNKDHAWSERYRSDSLDDVYALCAELC